MRCNRLEFKEKRMRSSQTTHGPPADVTTQIIHEESELPTWLDRDRLARFFHETLKPYEDTIPDISRAIDYGFSSAKGEGGFLLLASRDDTPVGAVLMLSTGMRGYIPEYCLVFVSVSPEMRGKGLGGRIIMEAIDAAGGDVKLHVEHDNPAKRLYERLGFTNKYAEMRYLKDGGG
jgi:ribosomal-protein-alanine N-acetyltransferase